MKLSSRVHINITTALVFPEAFSPLLEPLNEDFPEALLPIGCAPLLEFSLQHLQNSGITTVYVCVRRFSKQIQTYLSRTPRQLRVQVVPLIGPDQIQIMRQAFERVAPTEPFFMICGPVLTNINLNALQHQLQYDTLLVAGAQKASRDSLLCQEESPLTARYLSDELLELETTTPGTRRIHLKPQNTQFSANFQLSGVFLCSSSLSKLVQVSKLSTFQQFLMAYLKTEDKPLTVRFAMEQIGELSARIDSARAYRGICRAFLKRYFHPYSPEYFSTRTYLQSAVGENTTFGHHLQLKGLCVIGNNCKIDGNIDGSQLGDRCIIERGASIESCVVMSGTTIRQGASLNECILMGGCYVEDVQLPKGSVIGPSVVLKQEVVDNALRCFAMNFWEDSEVEQRLDSNDFLVYEMFKHGEVAQISGRIIALLPPIYIMRQYMKTADQQQYREKVTQPASKQNYFKQPIYLMPFSTTKQKQDADAYNHESGHEDEEEEVEEQEETESIPDSTAPSSIIKQLDMLSSSQMLDCYWLCNHLILKARELLQVQKLDQTAIETEIKRVFTHQLVRSGFAINKHAEPVNAAIWSEQMKAQLNPEAKVLDVDEDLQIFVIGFQELAQDHSQYVKATLESVVRHARRQKPDPSFLASMRRNLQLQYVQYQATNALEPFQTIILKSFIRILSKPEFNQQALERFKQVVALMTATDSSSSHQNFIAKPVTNEYSADEQVNDVLTALFQALDGAEQYAYSCCQVLLDNKVIEQSAVDEWIEMIRGMEGDEEDEISLKMTAVVCGGAWHDISNGSEAMEPSDGDQDGALGM